MNDFTYPESNMSDNALNSIGTGMFVTEEGMLVETALPLFWDEYLTRAESNNTTLPLISDISDEQDEWDETDGPLTYEEWSKGNLPADSDNPDIRYAFLNELVRMGLLGEIGQ